MSKLRNHRRAFTADSAFIARLEAQPRCQLTAGSERTPTQLVDLERTKRGPKTAARIGRVQATNMDGRRDVLIIDPDKGDLTAFFPGAMLLSLNTMLRAHNAKTTALKATWLKRVEALKLSNLADFTLWTQSVSRYPVVVEEVYITGESNVMDHESVAAACKPILDAFVKTGFLPDDSGKFIAQPLAYTERGDAFGLMIRFRPVPNRWGHIECEAILSARRRLV